MESHREDLHDHLVAVLEAAPELPREDRRHLADVFLDELDAQFRLVPRTQDRQAAFQTNEQTLVSVLRRWWPALAAGFALLVLLPSVLWLVGLAVGYGHPGHHYGYHPPFFFAPLLFFLLFVRFSRHWARRKYGPREDR
jgi:hypothetical protein